MYDCTRISYLYFLVYDMVCVLGGSGASYEMFVIDNTCVMYYMSKFEGGQFFFKNIYMFFSILGTYYRRSNNNK